MKYKRDNKHIKFNLKKHSGNSMENTIQVKLKRKRQNLKMMIKYKSHRDNGKL